MEYGSKSLGKIPPKTNSLPDSNQEWGFTFLARTNGDQKILLATLQGSSWEWS
jgi:hypothetical protein